MNSFTIYDFNHYVIITSKISAGLLFGVSINGNKKIHNSNRIYSNGKVTYNQVLKNIKAVKERSLIGTAVTIKSFLRNCCNKI